MKQKEERNMLEKMMDVASDAIDGNVPQPGETPEIEAEPTFDIDYDKLQKDCDKQARKQLKKASGMMLGDELVKNNDYLKNKLQTDLISLSGMLYQMEVTKIMQKDLMEEVRKGAKHPRMYEVFSTLAKTVSENNKQLLQTTEALKVSYVNLRGELEEIQGRQLAAGNGAGLLQQNGQNLITQGSKELINETKKLRIQARKSKDSEIIDVNPEESNT